MDKKSKNLRPKDKSLENKVKELTEALQRERADAINLRHRHEQQIAELKSMVKAAVITDLLPALDNLQLALVHAPKDIADHDYVKGVQAVARQFDKALIDLGVERIKTVGEVFDPNLHEAMNVDGDGEVEVIAQELQPGYRIGEEVIRHSKVIVKRSK